LDVLDGLQLLLDKSLLYEREDSDGEPRFMMLETIREYALERLEISREAATVRRRHADYYLALAEIAEPNLQRAEQVAWLDRLAAEIDNLRAALTWSRTAADAADLELRLAGALWLFWGLRGYLSEGRAWLARALGQNSEASTVLRALGLTRAGELAWWQGDF